MSQPTLKNHSVNDLIKARISDKMLQKDYELITRRRGAHYGGACLGWAYQKAVISEAELTFLWGWKDIHSPTGDLYGIDVIGDRQKLINRIYKALLLWVAGEPVLPHRKTSKKEQVERLTEREKHERKMAARKRVRAELKAKSV